MDLPPPPPPDPPPNVIRCEYDTDCGPSSWCANIPGECIGKSTPYDPECNPYNNKRIGCLVHKTHNGSVVCQYIGDGKGYCASVNNICTINDDCYLGYECRGSTSYCKPSSSSGNPEDPCKYQEATCRRAAGCIWYTVPNSGTCAIINE